MNGEFKQMWYEAILLVFFKADVTTSALKTETALLSETLASTDQSTRRFNPKENL
jgi:hypothetical protein